MGSTAAGLCKLHRGCVEIAIKDDADSPALYDMGINADTCGVMVTLDRQRMLVVDRRISAKRPDRGIITMEHAVLNQQGEPVLSMISRMMVEVRGDRDVPPKRICQHLGEEG